MILLYNPGSETVISIPHHIKMQLTNFFLSTLALASAAVAQGTNSGSGSTTVHVVKVGENGLTFSPDQLTAAVGDMVQFQFYPQVRTLDLRGEVYVSCETD